MPEPTYGAPVAQDPSDIDAPAEITAEGAGALDSPGLLATESAGTIAAPSTLTTIPAVGLSPLEELPNGEE